MSYIVKHNIWSVVLVLLASMIMTACSSEEFLENDDKLLTSVKMTSDDSSLDPSIYRLYVRQEPNSKWFNLFKVPLGLYCISSTDTTKSSNKFWQRLGEAPVIYSAQQTEISTNAIALAMKDKGYLQSSASSKCTVKGKKAKVEYSLHPGKPYIINRIIYEADNPIIDSLINISKSESLLHKGMMCDASVLDKERTRINNMLHNHGYYRVLKNFMRYEIDTIAGPDNVTVKLIYAGNSIASDTTRIYDIYHMNQINFFVNNSLDNNAKADSLLYNDDDINITYLNTTNRTFRPKLLRNATALKPTETYRYNNVTKTYEALSKLEAINYVSIQLQERDSALLDCNIQLLPKKINTFGVELEGTNTSGNLGIASNVSYTNRNLFRGSEVWTTKLKGAYEAITGLEGYSDQNYIELALETKLSFPRLITPFRTHRTSGFTNLSLQFDTQERPEFHRRVLTALWNYQWTNKSGSIHHRLDLPSLNYVYMPWISSTFRKEYLESDNYRSALIRYAYENLLILNVTYSHTYKSSNSSHSLRKTNPYQLYWSVESAGNLLYALSKPLGLDKDKNNQYTLFNVAYAQYIKFDFDFSKNYLLNSRNSFAIHTNFGIAQPYGNSTIVPFEKRYFGGGANGIRGWSVRELGPGRYMGEDGKVDFINQTGNLKLLFSMEYRTNLFWKVNGAVFVDAGNIWTTRRYEVTGKNGQFRWDTFYKQIAASYGAGLRLNLDYFILRFDMAMKAINPAYETNDKGYLPLIRPKLSRDFTFHFAVGLPF